MVVSAIIVKENGRTRDGRFDVRRHDDFLNHLADFHQLCGPGAGMRLQLAPLRPSVRFVVMVDVAEEQAVAGSVNNQANVGTHPHRPEVFVPGLVELMKLQPGVGGIELQVERGGFDGLLLVAGQAGETVGECVGDKEVHIRQV